MKKFIALLLALLLVTLSAAALAEEDRLAAIMSRGTLSVATEGDWPPWTYEDDNGNLTGFDVELAYLIAAELGVTPDFSTPTFNDILTGVQGGRFDVAINGVDYTEQRKDAYTWSDPYLYPSMVLVVRGDNEDIKDFEDLAGKITSNSPGSSYAEAGEWYGSTVSYVDTLAETMLMVLQGRADATINAEGSITGYMAENPDANLKIVAVSQGDPVAIPMHKGDSDSLAAAINGILQQLRENGKLAELSIKYFDADLTNP